MNEKHLGDALLLRRVDLNNPQGNHTGPRTRLGLRRENFEHSHAPDFAARTAIDRVGFRFV